MIILYKPLGLTPYQAILKLKEDKPELSSAKLSYAGRLDPMAEGLLMILEGDENKERRRFEQHDKVYEFEALLGFSSDSYDLLGIASLEGEGLNISTDKINDFISQHTGKIIQECPPYSSVKVGGKPLYWWTLRNKKVKIPQREINIISLEFLDSYLVSKKFIEESVNSRVPLVNGDFRQGRILKNWSDLFKEIEDDSKFRILKFRAEISAGGYVRSVVNSLGEFLGCRALTFSIKRTEIGSYAIKDSANL